MPSRRAAFVGLGLLACASLTWALSPWLQYGAAGVVWREVAAALGFVGAAAAFVGRAPRPFLYVGLLVAFLSGADLFVATLDTLRSHREAAAAGDPAGILETVADLSVVAWYLGVGLAAVAIAIAAARPAEPVWRAGARVGFALAAASGLITAASFAIVPPVQGTFPGPLGVGAVHLGALLAFCGGCLVAGWMPRDGAPA